MNHSEFQLRGLTDPQLSVHATGALPAWLWSTDGTRILWANPVGARLFGAANGTGLAGKTFGPADAHRRQVAQLSRRLPPNGALRLERLRAQQLGRVDDGVLEREILESVQRVVMHEETQGSLLGQNARNIIQDAGDKRVQIGRPFSRRKSYSAWSSR